MMDNTDLPLVVIMAVCLVAAVVMLRLHRDRPKLLRWDGWVLIVLGLIAAFTTRSTGPSIAGVAFVAGGIGVLIWVRRVKT